ncbi:MAG: DinB family protein [Acidobacteriaceae bacterium]|nr:DinB family protein [Acidobacteriaceae bacterium]MBV9295149.1 DinB family protein [Acidobacteriaceae bacterium]
MKKVLLALVLTGIAVYAQKSDPLEGLWQGYDGEWMHCSRQLIELAQAIPKEKYSWRPGPGVRSTSEVFMHIVIANYGLMARTGKPFPTALVKSSETSVTSKAQVIDWLKRSLDAVKTAHLQATPAELEKHVTVANRDATVAGIYLRILIHANEHMGQLVAYARVNGIVPPWSETAPK